MASSSGGSKLSALQAKMKARLSGGHFRALNEKLYTQAGAASFEMLQREPHLFDVYHEGYRAQVEGWPRNPLDDIIEYISSLPETLVVADFGCGEARLSASVRQRVHAFDLVCPPGNKYITPCNIAHVPLGAATVDVAVYCLSLMGTDYLSFLVEGARVLKAGGQLLIAEVQSRFQSAAAGQRATAGKRRREAAEPEPDAVDDFTKAVEALGFELEHCDRGNSMFVLMHFVKLPRPVRSTDDAREPEPATAGGEERKKKRKKRRRGGKGEADSSTAAAVPTAAPMLKACTYKKR